MTTTRESISIFNNLFEKKNYVYLPVKEYTRSTHYFNNSTREWVYRGDRGEEKWKEWNENGISLKLCEDPPKWSLGVHGFTRDHGWVYLKNVIDNNINYYSHDEQFDEEFKLIPNQREVVKKAILEEFETLIKLDMVRVREINRAFNTKEEGEEFIYYYNS